jgi:hypothetical protein
MRLSSGVGKELRRVGNRRKIEALGRRRGAGGQVVGPAEQLDHVLERAASQADIHHGSDEHAHHALKEAVRLDVEAHTPAVRPRFPVGEDEMAAVVRLVRLGGECAEVVIATDNPSRGLKQLLVERLTQRPLEGTSER